MDLEDITKFIGCFVLVLIILSIPCLCVLSWVLHWSPSIICALSLFTAGMVIIIATLLFAFVE